MLAKERPGELNYGSGASGVPTHLCAELFKSMAGVNIVRVPYKGTGPALNGLLAGEVQLLFALPGTVMPNVKSGRLKALAVSSMKPTALAPGLPTIAESGVPGYEVVSMLGVFVPSGTPATIAGRLNAEIVRALNGPDVKGKFFSAGIEATGSTPAQFSAMVKSETVKWIKVIRDAGIRAE
jgi:tripartite-type tricarboxylate transporter receptor subunit TctC